MAFKKVNGKWVPDIPEFELGIAFSAGDWNQGPGGGRFTPAMRHELDLARKVANLSMAGCKFIEFHDTEALPDDAPKLLKIVEDGGLKVHMCTANLFKRPEFVNGNFGSPDPKVRQAAINYTKEYLQVGIEIFKANLYVYWTGSNGINVPFGVDYRGAYERTAECLAMIMDWQINTFGAERALPFLVEPKPNEPPAWSYPGDVGEVLAVISMLPPRLQPFFGANPETCHSQMGGKRFAMELGLAAAKKKLWYVHLNGGSENPKFDEDRAFGDINFTTAVEIVWTLREIGFRYPVGLDVQPLPGDRNDQQVESVARSLRNFDRAMTVCDRIDPKILAEYQLDGDQASISDYFVSCLVNE